MLRRWMLAEGLSVEGAENTSRAANGASAPVAFRGIGVVTALITIG